MQEGYRDVFGISRLATPEEIIRAYEDMIVKWSTEKDWYAKERIQEIKDALHGMGVEALDRGDHLGAAQLFRTGAEQGDADCQHSLGEMIEKGLGGGQSTPSAVTWFKKAAAQGHTKAHIALGMFYENRYKWKRVVADADQALAHFYKSAKLGDAEGQYLYGYFLSSNLADHRKDRYQESLRWLRIASENKHPGAAEQAEEVARIVDAGKDQQERRMRRRKRRKIVLQQFAEIGKTALAFLRGLIWVLVIVLLVGVGLWLFIKYWQ